MGDSTICLHEGHFFLSGVPFSSGGNMLEWKPRLVLLLVALASIALFVSLLKVGGGTSIVQYSW
jgi:hypothetical protein